MGVEELKILMKPYPDQTGGAIWDLWLYGILVLQFILLVLLFQGSLRDVMMIAAAMIAAFMDKLYIFGFVDPSTYWVEGSPIAVAVSYHTLQSFFTWGARVLMFAAPLLIITQTKISKAKPVAVLTALVTLVYVFGRWGFQIRLAARCDTQIRDDPRCIYPESGGSIEFYVAQSGIMLFVIAEAWYRRRRMLKVV